MMKVLKEQLQATSEHCEIRDIMCNFFCNNKPKLINGNSIIDYTILNGRVEIDTSTNFEMLTSEDVANAVIVDDSTIQVPNPRKLYKQIVTLSF